MTPLPSAVIVHMDFDCFYVAVEREVFPQTLCGQPVAVSQYNPYGALRDTAISSTERIVYNGSRNNSKNNSNCNCYTKEGAGTANSNTDRNGSLIAVSYEARAQQVKRNDRGLEAIRKCPELVVVQVPVQNGKANLTLYRDTSERLMQNIADGVQQAIAQLWRILLGASAYDEHDDNNHNSHHDEPSIPRHHIKVEKASIDEIYMDLSSAVQALWKHCDEANQWTALHQTLMDTAARHTTIGGLDTNSATNCLSKTDIRKGSSLQVLAPTSEDQDTTPSWAWWNRVFPEDWTADEIQLAVASHLTLSVRQSIIKQYQGIFTLSAGISVNKTMAKLASGLKKPNQQTLVNPHDEITLQKLFHPLPIGRIRGLGGKFGEQVAQVLQVDTVGALAQVPLTVLRQRFEEKQATFLFRTAQGICDEPVKDRSKPKCIGSGKTFRNALAIPSADRTQWGKWLKNLSTDVSQRVNSDPTRYPKNLVCGLHLSLPDGTTRHVSQSTVLSTGTTTLSVENCTAVAVPLARSILGAAQAQLCGNDNSEHTIQIVGMSVTATNFVARAQGPSSIMDAFERCKNHLSPARAINAPDISQNFVVQKRKPSGPFDKKKATSVAALLRSTMAQKSHPLGTAEPIESEGEARRILPVIDQQVQDSSSFVNESHSKDIETARRASEQPKDSSFVVNEHDCTESETTVKNPETFLKIFSISHEDEKDHDLEYARKLQASFDRENETLQELEHRRSSLGQRKRRKSNPISDYFRPVRKRCG